MIIDPDFVEHSHRRDEYRHLWLCVLKLAVEDWFYGCKRGWNQSRNIEYKPKNRNNSPRPLYFMSAKHWFFDEATTGPGSFSWVGLILDYDPDFIRTKLRQGSTLRRLEAYRSGKHE